MKLSGLLDTTRLARSKPIPHDIRKAISFLREGIGRKVSVAALAKHCGVAERTLNKHFCEFLGLSPLRYLCRLRLATVRDRLLAGGSGISVTDVARTYGFTHLGRFSAQYRQCFGEAPSTTLRRARIANSSERRTLRGNGETRPRGLGLDRPRSTLALRERPSIAVLPAQVSARELTHHWFAESVAEGIAAALCSVRSLSVMVPRSSRVAMRDPQRSARDLGARYFLTARMIYAGTRLRVVVLLADTTTAHHVWGDSYDGTWDDLLELQKCVIEGVVRAVLPSIRGSEIDRVRRTRPQDLDAYGMVMRALPFVFASQAEATRRALELLDRAMEIDPDYGLATALAAWCHSQLVMYNATQTPAEERMSALRLAQRAAILDTDDPLVLTARCAVHTMAREFDVADGLLVRALALDPTSAWAWGRSGWLNSYRGHSEVAIEHFGRAISLDPYSASNANSFVGIGSAHFDAGRYDAAALWMRKALLEQPDTLWANRTLSVSYARLGERLKALESLEALRRYCPDLTVDQVVAAIPFRSDYLDRLGEGLNRLGLPT
jgi:adenylate cyclase